MLLKLWLIGNRTSGRPIWSVIILVIKQIGLPPLVWLQTELDSTQSCYHYKIYFRLVMISRALEYFAR